jgi:hypothetical protein
MELIPITDHNYRLSPFNGPTREEFICLPDDDEKPRFENFVFLAKTKKN